MRGMAAQAAERAHGGGTKTTDWDPCTSQFGQTLKQTRLEMAKPNTRNTIRAARCRLLTQKPSHVVVGTMVTELGRGGRTLRACFVAENSVTGRSRTPGGGPTENGE